VSEYGSVESTPMIDGRNMVMVIGPHKNKATAKAEAEARRTANKAPRTRPETSSADSTAENAPTKEDKDA
jgi:translation initiation factor IF-3